MKKVFAFPPDHPCDRVFVSWRPVRSGPPTNLLAQHTLDSTSIHVSDICAGNMPPRPSGPDPAALVALNHTLPAALKHTPFSPSLYYVFKWGKSPSPFTLPPGLFSTLFPTLLLPNFGTVVGQAAPAGSKNAPIQPPPPPN